ncbi:MAG: radical SAM protein [Firmicutes bacterium]|nr:radical SAM protein [Bacillota bacterium]
MDRTRLARVDVSQTPLVTIWEVTRACALACRHCRAEAIPRRHPLELTTEEGYRLMDQVRELGSPLFVLTGGDPLLRPDFFDLIRYATEIGLRVAATPSGTGLLTRENIRRAAEAGLRRVAFSLDGVSAGTHDAFRGVKGSFRLTLAGIEYAREAGMEVQVNTTVTRYNLAELREMPRLLEELGVRLWAVFFLVPVGRGLQEDMITPEEHEEVCRWLVAIGESVPFPIKTTEAPFYRRVAIQMGRPVPYTVNDGKGFVFIDHLGNVCPSGFLPLPAGNIREQPLAEIYRNAPLFRDLRNPDLLKGKCGRCEYRSLCGGSRARAWALTGDPLASDPACPYEPEGAPGAAASA